MSIKTLLTYCLILFPIALMAQVESETAAETKEAAAFFIRGTVLESQTNKPIPKVNVQVDRGTYTTTNSQGEFRIMVRMNDEITIKHKDFETVYYTVNSNERITVKVGPAVQNFMNSTDTDFYDRGVGSFNSLLDSADVYMKTDAEKSVQFVADALAISSSTRQNGQAYETLGDVYMQWNQFDLAATNYRISLQSIDSDQTRLKLGEAFRRNNNFQESLEVYSEIDKNKLNTWDMISLFEGIGDVYYDTQDYQSAIDNYKLGLSIAQDSYVSPKITDLNSKIAQTYDASGDDDRAEGFFQKSLDLATQENKKRAVQEKIKVADFQNKKQEYDAEIQNRVGALDDLEEIAMDSLIDNTSPLTVQKQNYKIGNAFYLQKDFDNAIPYLEKSIEEAELREDLVVKKDATRKLSEVYRDAGNSEKALEAYNNYIETVDELYSKKEQEIIQNARFRQELTDKQNRISSLESDRALSSTKYELAEEKNKRQLLIIYSLAGGLLLLLVTGYFMYKYIRQQRLANNLLALKSLRSQMNPHFIFNALNSVNSFIASSDERTANKYLSDFSFLMRSVLENSEEDFIPLSKEIELLELYTKLEHFRFKDKFDYDITVKEDVKVEEFQIPPMLLQPYIENAVWHGLRYKKTKGKLEIIINQTDKDEIEISIIDDGVGRLKSKEFKTDNQRKQNSKGMNNIKKRVAILNDMYKDKVDVSVSDYTEDEDPGTKVIVKIKKD